MKVQKAVLKETGHIAIGVLIADVIMCIVFALLKKFDYTVVLGALLGTGIAVANFFFLGVTLQKAVGMQEFASKYVRQSYSLRMFFCFAGVIVSAVARASIPSRRSFRFSCRSSSSTRCARSGSTSRTSQRRTPPKRPI